MSKDEKEKALIELTDSSLLMLADILPTGVFAALQAINHPKVAPVITGRPWPLCFSPPLEEPGNEVGLNAEDKVLTVAIIGLGPVGVCAAISILDALAIRQLPFRIVAIDPVKARREKMKAVYTTIVQAGEGTGEFVVLSIEEAREKVEDWTGGVGCTTVLEVCFPVPASDKQSLNLKQTGCWKHKCTLPCLRPCPRIWSSGIRGRSRSTTTPFHWSPVLQQKCFIRLRKVPRSCDVPISIRSFRFVAKPVKYIYYSHSLVKRQDVFGSIGEPASLIDRVVDFTEAADSYRAFDKGEVGKVIFDPWK